MVSLATAVFDLVLPWSGLPRVVPKAEREETEFRKLFEKAIGNFFAAELDRDVGWRVYPGKHIGALSGRRRTAWQNSCQL